MLTRPPELFSETVKEVAALVPRQVQGQDTQRLLGCGWWTATGSVICLQYVPEPNLSALSESDAGGVADVEFMFQYRELVQWKQPPTRS